MALQHAVTQGCLVVELPPELDVSNAEYVRMQWAELCRARLGPAATQTAGTVVVDWSKAPFITMRGVAVLEGLRARDGLRHGAGLPGAPRRVSGRGRSGNPLAAGAVGQGAGHGDDTAPGSPARSVIWPPGCLPRSGPLGGGRRRHGGLDAPCARVAGHLSASGGARPSGTCRRRRGRRFGAGAGASVTSVTPVTRGRGRADAALSRLSCPSEPARAAASTSSPAPSSGQRPPARVGRGPERRRPVPPTRRLAVSLPGARPRGGLGRATDGRLPPRRRARGRRSVTRNTVDGGVLVGGVCGPGEGEQTRQGSGPQCLPHLLVRGDKGQGGAASRGGPVQCAQGVEARGVDRPQSGQIDGQRGPRSLAGVEGGVDLCAELRGGGYVKVAHDLDHLVLRGCDGGIRCLPPHRHGLPLHRVRGAGPARVGAGR